MAVRLSATGQDFTRALALGSLTAITASFWWKVSVDRNTYSSAFFVDNGQPDNWGVQTGVDGTTANVIMDGTSTASVAMTVGTWYFGCLALSGSTGTFYYKAAGATSLSTTAITGVTATNAATLRLGESPWGAEWLNGCLASFKLWSAQLTQAEIELEAAQYVPNRFTSLVSWHPLLKTETVDYSGNARTLSGGTGSTTEDGPPVPWKLASPRVTTPAASGISGTASPAQSADTSSASGTLGYTGTSSAGQAANTASATGVLGYSGTTASSQAGNTATASGTVAAGISGTASPTQANQTTAASGILGYSGSGATSQASQTSAASGVLGYAGTTAGVQAANTAAASGSVGAAGSFTGTAAATQAAQTASASGTLGYTGTSTALDAADVSAAAGTVVNLVTGTAQPVQQAQFSIANGILRYTGTSTAVAGANTSTASGLVANPITGTGAAVQASQVAAGAGQFAGLVTFGTASAATGPVPSATGVTTAAATAKAASMTVPTATGG